jgi:hypothetical protein
MPEYRNEIYEEERALYGIKNSKVTECRFEGPADGESALKETDNITVNDCLFRLRYPMWHMRHGEVKGCELTDTCRAALWYDKDIDIKDSKLYGIKALRECDNVSISDSDINSPEFGWFIRSLKINNINLTSEYPFMRCRDVTADNLNMTAKYSFQYTENMVIRNSVLKTKDAFWHTRNVTVTDSVIDGEYLGWYSEGLTLIRCRIIGTQPLCYAKDLTIKDCTMEGCDFSFERSSVNADVCGNILSVKDPLSGHITAESIGDIIMSGAVESTCDINTEVQAVV